MAILVVGRRDFDEGELQQYLEHGDELSYFSQEDYLNYLLFGPEPNYYRGDP